MSIMTPDMAIELPSLYPHQEDHKNRVRAALKTDRAVILCANPGVGKTRMSKWILGSYLNHPVLPGFSGRALFAVHQRSLVYNAIASFNQYPALPHGVIMSQHDTLPSERLQVASIDTLLSWYCEKQKDGGLYKSDLTFDVCVFDEIHAHFPKFQRWLIAHNQKRAQLGLRPSFVIGLSATPQAKGLSDMFESIITGPSTDWLTENGFLSPFRYYRATQGDLAKLVRRKNGEFTEDSDAAAMSVLLNGDLVRDYFKYAAGRATIGFFPRRETAMEAYKLLKAADVRVAYVDCDTPDEERQRIFDALREGDLDYVCNVGIVERGTDIPRVGCIQMCTAVGSLVRWRQMIGRGSRVHPDVPDCIVLDHGGNIRRHGFFNDPVEWILGWSSRPIKEQKVRATCECPNCQNVYRGGKCRACGYEPTQRELIAQGLRFDGQELSEIKPESIKRMKNNEPTNMQIFVQEIFAAGPAGLTFRQLLAICYRRAEAYGRKFRLPKKFKVAGRIFQTPKYGSASQSRQVKHLFPFSVGDWSDAANSEYLVRYEK